MKKIMFSILLLVSTSTINTQYYSQLGDINEDEIVNILDIVIIVDCIMNPNVNFPQYMETSDINVDGIINILDIIYIVSSIVGNDCDNGYFPCENNSNECCLEPNYHVMSPNFYLDDAHAEVGCADCHDGGEFSDTETNCESCHMLEYLNTTSPNHSDQVYIHYQCDLCHTATGWDTIVFTHDLTNYACSFCHNADLIDANQNVTQHEALPNQCTTCHLSTTWNELAFNHNQTNYPLEGLHSEALCTGCHGEGFNNVQTECTHCHIEDYDLTTDPNHGEQIFLSEDCEGCHSPFGWEEIEFTHESTTESCNSCHSFNYEIANQTILDHENFSSNCTDCHVTTTWQESVFDHDNTNFQLLDSHLNIDCSDCHTDLYVGTPQNCDGCHLEDYQATFEPPHEEQIFLAEDCVSCHDATIWENTNFEHDLNSNNCNECHLANYNDALVIAPDHESFPQECETCHITTSWQESIFDHNLTDFPLEFSHELTDCSLCHIDSYQNTDTNCQSCHQDDYVATENPVHSDQVYLEDECATCHSAVGWDDILFDHVFTSENCNSCHNANYEIANINVEGHEEFPEDCTTCHTTQNWQENIFDHNTTNFELIGNHIETDCSACHSHGFENTTTECSICHLEDYSNTENPPHTDEIYLPNECDQCHSPNDWNNEFIHDESIVMCNTCHKMDLINANDNIDGHGDLSINCTECHNTDNWAQVTFNHDETNYPLTGMHQNTQCSSCHTESFQNTSNLCENCHEDNYFETTNPIHNQQIYIITECEGCHTTTNWSESIYSHAEESECYSCHQFDFVSAIPNHTDYEVDCMSCHLGTDTWDGAGFDHESTVDACISCHEDDQIYAIENIVGHDGFLDNCVECHITDSWTENVFDHNLTTFPLLDSHGGLECTECHITGFDYETMPTECEFCHFNEYLNTTNPVHWEQEYVVDNCDECHNATTWINIIFDHNLTEADCFNCHQVDFSQATNPDHSDLSNDCELCHNSTSNWQDAVFNHELITGGCAECHQSDYDHTTEPNHIDLSYSTNCETCHATDTWLGATFDHASINNGCYDCHQIEFEETTNPNHIVDGYSISCELCHATDTWLGASFNHDTITSGCYDCHQDDFNSTTDPNHVNEGYSTDCESCHIVDNWDTVDPHANASGNCTNCHNYNGLDGDTNPDIDHSSAPKLGNDIDDCELCHNSTSNWSNINFENTNKHDISTYNIYFNINSGDHNNEWSNCTTDCHVFGDFDTFSCYESCHEDTKHNVSSQRHGNESCSGWNGYWNIGSVQWSTGSLTNPDSFDQCYSCHPNGSNDGPCGDD